MAAFDRRELFIALQNLRHTVSTADDFPILQTVRFHDGTLMTFDGVVATRTPLGAGLTGSVPFQPLMQWVKAQKKDTIELTIDGGWATLKAGGSQLRLATLDGWPLKWPPIPHLGPVSPEWADSLRIVDSCRGVDINASWRLGVTMTLDGECVVFQASNNVTLAWASCPLNSRPANLILSPRLLDVFQAVKDPPVSFGWGERWIRITYGAMTVIGLRSAAKPDISRFAHADPRDEWELPFVSLPKDFDARVKQVCAIHRGSGAFRLNVGIEHGAIGLEAVGAVAQSREVWARDVGGHETAETTIDGTNLAAVVGSMTEMRIAGGLLLLKGPNSTIVIWPLGAV